MKYCRSIANGFELTDCNRFLKKSIFWPYMFNKTTLALSVISGKFSRKSLFLCRIRWKWRFTLQIGDADNQAVTSRLSENHSFKVRKMAKNSRNWHILTSQMSHSVLRNAPFESLKRCISRSDMAHFRKQKGFFTFDPTLFTFVNLYFAISFYQSFLPKNSLFERLRFVTMSHGWNFLISHRLHRFSLIKSA